MLQCYNLGVVFALFVGVQSPFCFCSVGAKAHERSLSAVHAVLMDAHRGSITTSIAALKRARETARAGVGRRDRRLTRHVHRHCVTWRVGAARASQFWLALLNRARALAVVGRLVAAQRATNAQSVCGQLGWWTFDLARSRGGLARALTAAALGALGRVLRLRPPQERRALPTRSSSFHTRPHSSL